MFGHMRGAFTDAHQNKKGLFEVAHRGTLFLDEVGEMPPSMQVKLLRALQEKTIRRVGGTEEIEVDVRVIAATNRRLEDLVQEKRLREDLFYRLNVIPIRLPPLRDRREDIPILAQHFLEGFGREAARRVTKISEEAMKRLVRHSWPGNVRELENVIERAVALETTDTVMPDRLPDPLAHAGDPGGAAAPARRRVHPRRPPEPRSKRTSSRRRWTRRPAIAPTPASSWASRRGPCATSFGSTRWPGAGARQKMAPAPFSGAPQSVAQAEYPTVFNELWTGIDGYRSCSRAGSYFSWE